MRVVSDRPTPLPSVRWEAVSKATRSQMEQLCNLATGKYGLDMRLLVEHAGRNLADLVTHLVPEGPVLVVAGRGHNGATGLAAARLLAARKRQVWVVPTHEAENYSGVPREQLACLQHFQGVRLRTSLPRMKFPCAIDAAIGGGLDGPPRGRTLDVITVLNQLSGCDVISLDTPTGVDADDGSAPGDSVRASATLCLGALKPGIRPGGQGGELFVSDLGLPPRLFEDVGLEQVELPGWLSRVE